MTGWSHYHFVHIAQATLSIAVLAVLYEQRITDNEEYAVTLNSKRHL